MQWSENIIIADADYIDRVAFNLSVNFERMIGRRIPKADMAQWLICVALDGGMRPVPQPSTLPSGGAGGGVSQVVLIHRKENDRLENFSPSDYATELDGQAFKDTLGEFLISALPVEGMVSQEDFFLDILGTVCQQEGVKRIMVVPNAEEGTLYDDIRETLHRLDAQTEDKRITVFTMEPRQGGNFRQELLGYSLMAALGIRGEEIRES